MKQLKKFAFGMVLALAVMGLAACGTRRNTGDTNGNTDKTTMTETNRATETNRMDETKRTTENTTAVTENINETNRVDETNRTGTNGNVNDATEGTGDRKGVVDEIGDDIRNGVDNIADDLNGNTTRETQNMTEKNRAK